MRRLAALLALGLFAASSHSESVLRLQIEDFEKPVAKLGWNLNVDQSGLGTTAAPQPFVPEGVAGRQAARLQGHLGKNQAPWSWVQLRISVNAKNQSQDLSKFKSVEFWVKGDGNPQKIRIIKDAVTDHDQYAMVFPTSSEWKKVALPFSSFMQAGWGKKVPAEFKDVSAIEFSPNAFDSDFDFAFDDVALSGEDVVLKPQPYITDGWLAYTGIDVAKRKGTALDASGILDAPAGKHGRVKAQGENFVFKNGKPARFFGVNVVAGMNFPDKEEAEAVAEHLAQLGVNITRHHHADAPWAERNFFGKGASTRKLDADSMDKFDYFVFQLQKRGIYQYYDMIVHRKPESADGVQDVADAVNGFKIEGEFAPDLINLQKEFVTQFMGHKNPYTGKTYGQDPACAMVEIINEDSLFYMDDGQGDFAVRGTIYGKVWQQLFNQWLLKKYKTTGALELAWAPTDASLQGLRDGEILTQGTVQPLKTFWRNEDWKKLSQARRDDEFRFVYDIQLGYFETMTRALRRSGFDGLITGSNHWVSHPADLYANAQLDYIDRHDYWAHPQGGWGYSTQITWDAQAMVRNPGMGVLGGVLWRRVLGKPYIVTEWQESAPNDYRQGGVLAMGLACALQNWSAIQFGYSHRLGRAAENFAGPLDSNFDIANQPGMLALWPSVARALARADFAPLSRGASLRFGQKEVFDPGSKVNADGRAALMFKAGLEFSELASDPIDDAVSQRIKEGWIISDGGQATHHPGKGQLKIMSPATQGFVGFTQGEVIQLPALTVEIKNPYVALVAQALDGLALEKSKRILLSLAGNAVNSGQALTPSGNQLAESGKAPVLLEPIQGKVKFKNGLVKVQALDFNGQPQGAPELFEAEGDGPAFEINGSAMYYEVTR